MRSLWCVCISLWLLLLSVFTGFKSQKAEKSLGLSIPILSDMWLIRMTHFLYLYRFQSHIWNILLLKWINYEHMLRNMVFVLIKNDKPCIFIPTCYIRLKMKSCVKMFYETELNDTIENPACIISNLICNLKRVLLLLLISVRGRKEIYFSCPKSFPFILLSSLFASVGKRLSITWWSECTAFK